MPWPASVRCASARRTTPDQIFANLETNLDNLLKNVTRCRQRLNSGMTD